MGMLSDGNQSFEWLVEHSSALSHECSGHTKFSFPHTQALLELEGFFHVYKRCVLSNLEI